MWREISRWCMRGSCRNGPLRNPHCWRARTSMRFCSPDGAMEFRSNGVEPPAGYTPWYQARKDDKAIVFGHWSAQGLKLTERIAALDSGCVWGGALSALRLEDRWLAQVPCHGYQPVGE